ncbi:MAG: hypothetical protein WCK89_07295 [bacterium]
MNKPEIIGYLTQLDSSLTSSAILHVYGSAVVILLDAPDRTSLDIDVAGPYSVIDQAELARVAAAAGLPVNPSDPLYEGNHLEWIGPLRLCLPPPGDDVIILWQGRKLTVRTGSVADFVASKLIRYDETDRADIQFLYTQKRFTWESVRESVERLPELFRYDALVRGNLDDLVRDMRLWEGCE